MRIDLKMATEKKVSPMQASNLAKIPSLLVLSSILAIFFVSFWVPSTSSWRFRQEQTLPIERHRVLEGIKQCAARYTKPNTINPEFRDYNPRVAIFSEPDVNNNKFEQAKVIRNAYIIDGDGSVHEEKEDIYLENGIIYAIQKSQSHESEDLLKSIQESDIIDARGHYVSPGLVEMHSHAGICSQPELKGVNDMFELMSPVTPFTRTIDAFNINDPAIKLIAEGGVTSSLILPSANLISGEGYVFKMSIPPSLSVEEMLVQYDPSNLPNSGKRQRWMKMACGENPKKRYVSRPDAPKSRMGLGYLFREYMHRATKLRDAQDEWCESISNNIVPEVPFPYEVDIEILVALLRGQVLSNAHCYETFDIETILRHAKEFDFEVNALHHALDAYKIPKILKSLDWNITIATFSTLWGFKKEAYQASLFSPGILEDNDINVVITTDHPALPGHSLIYQAQVAHNYGLSAEKAFASITGQSAKGLGLDHRIGFLRKGYDADIVIWNKHPLQAGSKPLKVFIDGFTKLDLEVPKKTDMLNAPAPRISQNAKHASNVTPGGSFLISGIRSSFVKDLKFADSSHEIFVKDGKVLCIDPSCAQFYEQESNLHKIELEDGFITPSIASLSNSHGIMEMDSEISTGDGDSRETINLDMHDPENILYAKDGLIFGSEHLKRARNSGVLNIITPPFRSEGKLFITGVSTAFKSNGNSLEDIIKSEVALHVTIGDSGRQPNVPTISAQIRFLKKLLSENKDKDNVYGRVARAELPLAVHVNSKDIIIHLLELKRDIGFYLVIIGGVEAHLISEQLKEAEVPVLANSWRCQRKFWDERRCLTGVGSQGTILGELHRSGVLVGLGYSEDQLIRLAADEAASAAGLSNLTRSAIVDMVSYNIYEIFNMTVPKNSFLISEHFPLDYGSHLIGIVEEDHVVEMYPQPEPNFDFYS